MAIRAEGCKSPKTSDESVNALKRMCKQRTCHNTRLWTENGSRGERLSASQQTAGGRDAGSGVLQSGAVAKTSACREIE